MFLVDEGKNSGDSIFAALADAVVEMDEALAVQLAHRIVSEKQDVFTAIEKGLVSGMAKAGDLYEAEEYFIPDILMCADAMNAAMAVFEPFLPKSEMKSKGRMVIGTIQGDTHDIGKNIVSLVVRSAGYDVLDLGRDVDPQSFVDHAVNFQADVIAISCLLTTTMNHMEKVIQLLKTESIRDRFKVIIGGKPLSEAFAEKIGADYYAPNAGSTLRLMEQIMKEKGK